MAAIAAITIAGISCLLQVLLVRGSISSIEGRWHESKLQMLSDVVSGPARGRPLALHLDAALPVDMWWTVLGVEVVQHTPHLTLSLGLNNSRGRRSQQETVKAALLRCSPSCSSSSMLHVVLWLTPQPELLQELWLQWKPHNLLLLNLGSSLGTDVLRDEALSGVKNLALIEHLSVEVGGSNTLGVYTVRPFSSSAVQLLGEWSHDLFSNWEALFPDRFSTFEGYIFQLAPYVDYPPFIYRPFVEESAFPTKKYGRGVAIQISEAISKKLNYTYTITDMVGKWGAIENGSWVGILGTMARKEKNFTISGFYLNEERLSGFDPSATVGSESSSVFVPSPKPLPEWLSIVRPFSISAWRSFVAVVAISVFFMAVMEKVTDGRSRTALPVEGTVVWQNLPRALVSQSIPMLPEVVWKRVFVAVWLLGCLVGTAAYTCNMVSIFTSITYPSRLRTLEDLADSDYRLALLDNGGYTVRLVLYSKGPLFQKMRQKLDLFSSIDDAVTALKGGQHAIVAIESSSQFSIMRQMKDDEWYVMEEKFFTGRTVWLFQKNTAWQHKLDENIQHLHYFGLIEHWYQVENQEWIKAHLGNRDRLGLGEDGPAPSLTLRHLQGVFYILGLAWVASAAVLVLELLVHRHQGR